MPVNDGNVKPPAKIHFLCALSNGWVGTNPVPNPYGNHWPRAVSRCLATFLFQYKYRCLPFPAAECYGVPAVALGCAEVCAEPVPGAQRLLEQS